RFLAAARHGCSARSRGYRWRLLCSRLCAFIVSHRGGASRCRRSQAHISYSRWIPPGNISAAKAANGKGEFIAGARSTGFPTRLMQSELIEASRAGATPPVGGSSFYAGMRVLPRPQRQAMFEIYRFCRAVDDIADGDAGRDVRLAELARWRADIRALFEDAPPERVRSLLEPTRTFDLQRADFLSVIDGMEMD